MGGWVPKLLASFSADILLLSKLGLLQELRSVAAFLEFLVILPDLNGRGLLLFALSFPLTSPGRVLDGALTAVLLAFLSLEGILTLKIRPRRNLEPPSGSSW